MVVFRDFALVANETRRASCFLIRHDGTARQALCEILSNVTIIHDFEAIPCGAVAMIARPKKYVSQLRAKKSFKDTNSPLEEQIRVLIALREFNFLA